MLGESERLHPVGNGGENNIFESVDGVAGAELAGVGVH